jgi:hypothetical protein
MSIFPIRRVDSRSAKAVETLGSKPKFWFNEGEKRLLFKAEDRGTGEDWAEVISSYLCELLGLPHVAYELAREYEGETCRHPGVVCENMAPPPMALVLGNQLLLAVDRKYPATQRFRVRQHTVGAVVEVVEILDRPTAPWAADVPPEVKSAMEVFVGYIMLDAWIANQDRHHENWGALIEGEKLWLAPTFDHGAALARNLTDKERTERLTTRDKNRTVLAFSGNARSAFYASATDKRPLGTREAFQEFARAVPQAKQPWLDRLAGVTRDILYAILERVPPDRMSETCRRFTLELLLTNQRRLLDRDPE